MNHISRDAMERFPFGVIFSKTSAADLKIINYDTDFCYYYFSPGLETRCSLKRIHMCDGRTNAKRDFKTDYVGNFKDDIEVVMHCTNGIAKKFCEPWSPPGVKGPHPFVYTLKTSLTSNNSLYMLGTFELIGETVLCNEENPSIITVSYDGTSPLPPLSTFEIPDQWFSDALLALPIGVVITTLDNTVLFSNRAFPGTPGDHLHTVVLSSFAPLYPPEDTKDAQLLHTARWQPSSWDHGRGLYHIAETLPDGAVRVLRVHVWRPNMKQADPYFADGELHAMIYL